MIYSGTLTHLDGVLDDTGEAFGVGCRVRVKGPDPVSPRVPVLVDFDPNQHVGWATIVPGLSVILYEIELDNVFITHAQARVLTPVVGGNVLDRLYSTILEIEVTKVGLTATPADHRLLSLGLPKTSQATSWSPVAPGVSVPQVSPKVQHGHHGAACSPVYIDEGAIVDTSAYLPKCDCGAAKCKTTHALWCSTRKS